MWKKIDKRIVLSRNLKEDEKRAIVFNRLLEMGWPIKAASKKVGWSQVTGREVKHFIWGYKLDISRFVKENNLARIFPGFGI